MEEKTIRGEGEEEKKECRCYISSLKTVAGLFSRTESKYHQEMEPKHPENDRNIPPEYIHKKETFCNQHESGRVFGTGVGFFEKYSYSFGIGKAFMRLSWEKSTSTL